MGRRCCARGAVEACGGCGEAGRRRRDSAGFGCAVQRVPSPFDRLRMDGGGVLRAETMRGVRVGTHAPLTLILSPQGGMGLGLGGWGGAFDGCRTIRGDGRSRGGEGRGRGAGRPLPLTPSPSRCDGEGVRGRGRRGGGGPFRRRRTGSGWTGEEEGAGAEREGAVGLRRPLPLTPSPSRCDGEGGPEGSGRGVRGLAGPGRRAVARLSDRPLDFAREILRMSGGERVASDAGGADGGALDAFGGGDGDAVDE